MRRTTSIVSYGVQRTRYFYLNRLAITSVLGIIRRLYTRLLVNLFTTRSKTRIGIRIILRILVDADVYHSLRSKSSNITNTNTTTHNRSSYITTYDSRQNSEKGVVTDNIRGSYATLHKEGDLFRGLSSKANTTLTSTTRTLLIRHERTTCLITKNKLANTTILADKFRVNFMILTSLGSLIISNQNDHALYRRVLTTSPFSKLTRRNDYTRVSRRVTRFTSYQITNSTEDYVQATTLSTRRRFKGITRFLQLRDDLHDRLTNNTGHLLGNLRNATLFLGTGKGSQLTNRNLGLLARLYIKGNLATRASSGSAMGIQITNGTHRSFLQRHDINDGVKTTNIRRSISHATRLAYGSPTTLATTNANEGGRGVITSTYATFFTFVAPRLRLQFLLVPMPFHYRDRTTH